MSSQRHTRVAVVQLDYVPAAVIRRRSLLEDPIYEPGTSDGLMPLTGRVPSRLRGDFRALRARIRAAWARWQERRVTAILEACQRWEVRIVVFPEYAIPAEILPAVRDASAGMVVVAGTHAVDEVARTTAYDRLGLPEEARPPLGQAVAPIFVDGVLKALQPKLNPAKLEQGSLLAGERWVPVDLTRPDASMGVLICLDFLYRESPQHQALVASALERCRFLAVPSLTPHHSIPEFAARAWEEARRYGRPVLYADGAVGGGSSLFVDEGSPERLGAFPDHPGRLERGDEGLIIADVDLGYTRAGSSTRYEDERPVRPFASPALLYRAQKLGDQHAVWLHGLRARITAGDLAAVKAEIARHEPDLLLAAALPGARVRDARVGRLLDELPYIHRADEVAPFVEELELPADLPPLAAVRAALARGAGLAVQDMRREGEDAGLGELADRLLAAGRASEQPDTDAWTPGAIRAIGALVQELRGVEPPAPVEIVREEVLPAGLSPALLGRQSWDGWEIEFRGAPRELGGDQNQEIMRDTVDDSWLNLAWLLAQAEGREDVCVFRAEGATAFVSRCVIHGVLWRDGGGWQVQCQGQCEASFVEVLGRHLRSRVSGEPLAMGTQARIDRVLAPFAAAVPVARALLDRKLAASDGHFLEIQATLNGETPPSAREALDVWFASGSRVALVLGSYGTGKSTLLARWCVDLLPNGPVPILVSLASQSPEDDVQAMILRAAGLEPGPATRAALSLGLINEALLPVLDGFDELATRVTDKSIQIKLKYIFSIVAGGGRLILSSRDHLFPTPEQAETLTQRALSEAAGLSQAARIQLQPVARTQLTGFVQEVEGDATRARQVLDQIARTHNLSELCERPLLLVMVLHSLSELPAGEPVNRARLYGAYLRRWLDQSRERHPDNPALLTDAQKVAFAETLAWTLWSTGRTSCGWMELREVAARHLRPALPEGAPAGSEFVAIRGGGFFVWEGQDHYAFAHKSFLEYFLASALLASDRPSGALDLPQLSVEVIDFMADLLREQRLRPLLARIRGWLTGPPAGDERRARANAVRLLHRLARLHSLELLPGLDGALLNGVALRGEDLRALIATGAHLREADLSNADLRGADLSDADLSGAYLSGARLDGVDLRRSALVNAALVATTADRPRLEDADLRGADLRAATWTGALWSSCRVSGARAPSALLVGQSLPGALPEPWLRRLAAAHRGSVWSVAWSPDGSRIASGGDDGVVRLWDRHSGAPLGILVGHNASIWSVVWSPDGSRIASGGEDNLVRLWDGDSGILIGALEGHHATVCAIAWSPDGSYIASGGKDGLVRMWHARSGAMMAALEGHRGKVLSTAWSSDGARLASGGDDGVVRLWDGDSGAAIGALEGHQRAVLSVAWSPDGARLASGGDDGVVRLWDGRAGTEIGTLGDHRDYVWSVAWSPDGTRLAITGHDGVVQVWDGASGTASTTLEGHRGRVLAVAWSPDGAHLASGGDYGVVRLWELASGAAMVALEENQVGVLAMTWSPDGSRLAGGGSEGVLRLWDSLTWAEMSLMEVHQSAVLSMAWSPDGSRFATGGGDGLVRLWDGQTGAAIATLKGHVGGVWSVAWSPDGARLASGGSDRWVRLWDGQSGAAIATLGGHQGGVWSVAWSPDGTRLVSGAEHGTILLRDGVSGVVTGTLEGHQGSVLSVVWSPDGSRLASSGDHGEMRLWNAISKAAMAVLEGHRGWVRSLAWSPDGSRLASGGSDGLLRLWDGQGGAVLGALEGHLGSVHAAAWSPDGTRLASGDSSGVLRLWECGSGRPLVTLQAGWETSLVSVPGAAMLRGGHVTDVLLAFPVADSKSRLFVPLGGHAGSVLDADKVRRALAGETHDAWLPTLTSGLFGFDNTSTARQTGTGSEVPTRGFTRGVPVRGERMIGRARELAELRRRVAQGQPTLIIGPRRSGKTSLLWALQEQLQGEGVPTLMTDLQAIPSGATPTDLVVALDPSLAGKRNASRLFLDRLRRKPDICVLIDEVDAAGRRSPDLLSWIRALAQRHGRVVAAASTALRLMDERLSHKSSAFLELPLGPLPPPEIQLLLERACPPDVPLRWDPHGERIWSLTSGWPFATQLLGGAIVDRWREGDHGVLGSLEQIDELYQHEIVQRFRLVYRDVWFALSEPDRQLIARMLRGGSGLGDADLDLISRITGYRDKPMIDWLRLHLAEEGESERDSLSVVRAFFEAAGWRVIEEDSAAAVADLRVEPVRPGDRRRVRAALLECRRGALPAEHLVQLIEATAQQPAPDLGGARPLFVFSPPLDPAARDIARAAATKGVAVIPLSLSWAESAIRQRRAREELDGLIAAYVQRDDPFQISRAVSAPGDFFLPQRAAQALLRDLDRGQSVGLFGLRKVGKSSLAAWLLRSRPGVAISINALSAADRCLPLLKRLPYELRKALSRAAPALALPDFQGDGLPTDLLAAAVGRDLEDALDRAWSQTGENHPITLHLDEVDRIVHTALQRRGEHLREYEALFGLLRALGETTPQRVVTVVTGFSTDITARDRALGEGVAGNPVFRYFNVHRLAPFDREGLDLMMTELGARAALAFSADALASIYRWSGGHPWLARLLGSQVLKSLGTLSGPVEVDGAAIDLTAKRMPEDQDLRSYPQELIERVADADCMALLRRVAASGDQGVEDGSFPEPPEDWALRDILVERDGRWFVFAELLAEWLRRGGR